LQAPLRAINGFSKILVDEFSGNLAGEARDFIERIQSSVIRMDRLIDDLLNFSRTSRQVINRSPVELTSLARQVFNELYEENRNGRTIEFSLASLPTTNVDYALFRQVFDNLLSNAIKYTQYRTIAKIEMGSLEIEGEQVIYVRDNGAGFDMQNADKLFGVFQRLHSNEEFEGTGIGLATVQRIINRHGGRIWAESKPDEGATFYFTIGS
jgi:light-regulated signal transduction histidine kinase (bacteriophytochrome)